MWRHEWKINSTWAYLAPLAILVIFLLDLWEATHRAPVPFPPRIDKVYEVLEVMWPLVLGLAAAMPLPLEKEQGTLEFRLSYPRPLWRTVVMKLSLPYVFWAGIGVGTALWLDQTYLSLTPGTAAALVLPPALFLGGLGVMASAVTLNALSSQLVVALCWAWDLTTASRQSGLLALFPYLMRVEDLNLTVNRWLLTGLGAAMHVGAVIALSRRRP